MAEGLPLIITRSGGAVEYVDDNAALIIERENIVENLRNAILYMQNHPEVLERMSDCGQVQCMKYDKTNYYKSFVQLINEIEEKQEA